MASFLPFFIVGLLGSVHCVGMCGGIVAAFSMAPPTRPPFPVAVVTQAAARAADSVARVLFYNLGRIASYSAAGALAGGLSALIRWSPIQSAGYALANLLLVALGLYLMDAWRGLAMAERAGQVLWRRIHPLTTRIMPLDHPLKLLALGALWGWLPCGMVYSVLLSATLSGSAAAGSATMLAFGLGTLPMLLLLGAAGSSLRALLQRRAVRTGAGLLVMAFGLAGLLRLATGAQHAWLDALCIGAAA